MRRRFRVHARRRRLRNRFLRFLVLILVVIAVAFVVKFLFSLGNYVGNFYQPRDFERQRQLEKTK